MQIDPANADHTVSAASEAPESSASRPTPFADFAAGARARLGHVARGGWAARIALIAGAGVLGMLAAGVATLVYEPAYAARATLIVKFGREYVYRPELEGIDGWQPSRMLELVNNEAQILQSRDLHAQVVTALATKPVPAEALAEPLAATPSASALPMRAAIDPDALGRFEEQLSIRAIGDTTIIHLAFEDPDPDYAKRALDLLLDRYFTRRAELLDSARSSAASLDALRAELNQARQRLTRFLNDNDAWDLERLREERSAEVLEDPAPKPIRPVRRPLGGRSSADATDDTGMLLSAVEDAEPVPQPSLRDLAGLADEISERRLVVEAAERAYAFALRRSVEDMVSRSLDADGISNVTVLDRPRVDAHPQGLPAWMRIALGWLLAAGAMTALLVLRDGGRVAASRAQEA